MKIAFAGKGGAGKTTLASMMIKLLAEDKRRILAVDADPNSNLAGSLGFPQAREIKPIVEMKDLIYERMDIKQDPKGSFYKLNPRIDDIPEKFIRKRNGIGLIVMGTVDAGGSGCVCPESTFLRELLKHLVLNQDEDIVMDMEAGIEHLGRSTAASMDCLLAVAEPTLASIETGLRVRGLAEDLKIKTLFIGNKIREKQDEKILYEKLGSSSIVGLVSYHDGMRDIDRGGSVMDLAADEKPLSQVREIKERLLKMETSNEQKKVTG
jgi:CO dehydrogenase maturation factor